MWFITVTATAIMNQNPFKLVLFKILSNHLWLFTESFSNYACYIIEY